MGDRKTYDSELHIHFLTCSCDKRRKLLAQDAAKRAVIAELGASVAHFSAMCLGFVIMEDHVHALVWFPEPNSLSSFIDRLKSRSARTIKELFQAKFSNYWQTIGCPPRIWQARYFSRNIFTRSNVEQKLDYMHLNPVRAGFVEVAADWRWSSARWYVQRKSVGLRICWPEGLEEE